jgi:hypothetical protein
MPLFDLFKKSNKKEPPQRGINGDAGKSDQEKLFISPERQKKRYEAAMEFLKVLQERTPLVNGKPHAGTVISVPARLAGTSLFRSINKKDFPPDVVVLSDEVNEAYPKLLNLFAYYCKQSGIDVMAKPVVTDFPEQAKPLMDLAQVQAEYQDQYNEIMKNHGLDYLEGAWAGMIVCSIVFNYHCISNKDIDPYVATGIVAMGVVEGAKTSPAPLKIASQSVKPDDKAKEDQNTELIRAIAESSIGGSGKRLFLGERRAAVQEALDHNGKFVLVHPEVEGKLIEKNFDPYLVYVSALIIEMQAKISQIDFAGGDVDMLTQEWGGMPEESVPVYIRQILWLKANAEKFGYQQNGNSWKLKL